MTVWAIWLVARQHRYELVLAALLSIAVGAGATYVTGQLAQVAVPVGCDGAWDVVTPATEYCLPYLEAVGRIYFGDGSKVLVAMAVVPLVVGLLGGIPVVGRELEAGTAQFAWAIAPSRRRWLLRQITVVGLCLLVPFGFSAIASEMFEVTRRSLMAATPFDNIGLHGTIAFARMVAALMVGLFVGALIGRTLPAFVIGSVLMIGLVLITGPVRQAWASVQPSSVVDSSGGDQFHGEVVGLAWKDPSGQVISYAEGLALVPPSTAVDGDTWLMENDYEQVQLGIAPSTANAWRPIEVAGWVGVGSLSMVGAAWLVSRRRPV